MNKNLVFTDSIQLTNFSLDKLVRNLSDEDFKCLVKKFGSKNLGLLKEKGAILMSTWTVSKYLIKKIAC